MSTASQSSIPKEEVEEVNPEIVIKDEEPMKEKNAPIYYPQIRHGGFKRCCVCGEMNQKNQMTIAPKSKYKLVVWSQIFGSEFLKTCCKDRNSHYICSIHWKQLRDDWEGPLPEVLEQMKKKNNGGFRAMCRCRYCGVDCFEKDMTDVPKNEVELMEWAKILGQQFLENVKMYEVNKICLTHFEQCHLKFGYRLNRTIDGIKNEEPIGQNVCFQLEVEGIKPETIIDQEGPMVSRKRESEEEPINFNFSKKGFINFAKCCLCGEMNEKCHMKMVPKQQNELAKWSLAFGPEFEQLCSKSYAPHYICSIHWDQLLDDWEGPLPEVLERMKKENNGRFRFEKCRHCHNVSVRDDMVLVPEEPLLSRWVEKLGLQFYNNLEHNSTNYICWAHYSLPDRLKPYYMKFLPSESTVVTLSNQKTERLADVKLDCRYCGARCDRNDMTTVPKNKEHLLKWVEILGQQFHQNVEKHKENLICWSHFKFQGRVRRNAYNLPMVDRMMNKESTDKEVKVEEMEQKPDVKMSIHEIKTEEESNESVLASDYACSSANLDSKLLIIPKDE